MKKSILVIFLLTLLAPLARADEGMWLVHFFEQSLIRQMKSNGLKMDPGLIFDQDRVSLSDAIVSMDFGCTGSMISQNGLLITNHHCAYSDKRHYFKQSAHVGNHTCVSSAVNHANHGKEKCCNQTVRNHLQKCSGKRSFVEQEESKEQ